MESIRTEKGKTTQFKKPLETLILSWSFGASENRYFCLQEHCTILINLKKQRTTLYSSFPLAAQYFAVFPTWGEVRTPGISFALPTLDSYENKKLKK